MILLWFCSWQPLQVRVLTILKFTDTNIITILYTCIQISPCTRQYFFYKNMNKRAYLPTVHSQCASRNVRTSPLALLAPKSLAFTRPTRSRERRTLVGTFKFFTCSSKASFKKSNKKKKKRKRNPNNFNAYKRNGVHKKCYLFTSVAVIIDQNNFI